MALSVRSATTAFSRVATAARPAQRQFSVVVRAGGQINADIKKDVDKVQHFVAIARHGCSLVASNAVCEASGHILACNDLSTPGERQSLQGRM
jgi:hypothetical protein